MLRTQLRGYRTHRRAAEDPVLRQKDVKAAQPGLPCAQRPLRPQAVLHRPEPRASAGTIETVFFFRDRLTTRLSVWKTGQEVAGNVPGRGALINIGPYYHNQAYNEGQPYSLIVKYSPPQLPTKDSVFIDFQSNHCPSSL